jgi:hypothetical protein
MFGISSHHDPPGKSGRLTPQPQNEPNLMVLNFEIRICFEIRDSRFVLRIYRPCFVPPNSFSKVNEV